jgi:hypothetical protein
MATTSGWPTIRQGLSLGKVNWTRQSSPIPIARIKARAIASAPVGPVNLFKPGAGKAVTEPQKQCRSGRHFNGAYLNSRKQVHTPSCAGNWLSGGICGSQHCGTGWVYTCRTWDALNQTRGYSGR